MICYLLLPVRFTYDGGVDELQLLDLGRTDFVRGVLVDDSCASKISGH